MTPTTQLRQLTDGIRDPDPRARVITALLLSLIAALARDFMTAWWALGLGIGLVCALKPRPAGLRRRLARLSVFMLALWAVWPLPVIVAACVGHAALVDVIEALRLPVMITLKANAILLLTYALTASLSPHRIGLALNALGIPDKLTQVFMLFVRQLEYMNLEYMRLRQAFAARAFRPQCSLHTLRTYGWAAGILVLRAMERADRVFDAMRCRGFEGRYHALTALRWRGADLVFMLLAVLQALAWIGMETPAVRHVFFVMPCR